MDDNTDHGISIRTHQLEDMLRIRIATTHNSSFPVMNVIYAVIDRPKQSDNSVERDVLHCCWIRINKLQSFNFRISTP